MLRHLAAPLAFLICLTTVACDRGAGSGPSGAPSGAPGAAPLAVKGSCNNAPKGFCNEFLGSGFTGDQVAQACRSQGVAHVAGPCPGAGLVGSCRVYAGQPMDSMYRYYASFPGGAAAAEQQCKQLLRGQWSR